jgi:hypothetical protein
VESDEEPAWPLVWTGADMVDWERQRGEPLPKQPESAAERERRFRAPLTEIKSKENARTKRSVETRVVRQSVVTRKILRV